MKNILKLLPFILIICILSSMVLPVSAVSLQEQSWLHHLTPSNMPKTKGKDSYPVELHVKVESQKEVVISGTCSLEGKLTDEDLIDAMKKAAASVDGYKSPENAVTDKLKIDELKNKLSFTEEEQNRIIKNWLSLVGMDKVADLLKGQLPSYGETDAVGVVVGMISSGKLPDAKALVPFPTDVSGFAQGLVINGAFISYDQYKRDQQKYQDIVELSNARARFREFNAMLNSIIKEKMKGKTGWTIRVQDQVIEDQLYRGSPEIYAPYFYTSDIVLYKNGNDIDDPVGTYQGDVKLTVDVSLEDYDRNFAQYLADNLNKKAQSSVGQYGGAFPKWYKVSQSTNRTSENVTVLEGKNVYVTLSESLGGVYDLELNVWALEVTKSKVIHDFVSVIEQKSEGATATLTWTEINDSESGTLYVQDHTVVVDRNGKRTESTNTDDTAFPVTDPRAFLKISLVVDMSDK